MISMNRSRLHAALVRLARHSSILRLAVYAREVARLRRAAKHRLPLGELVRQFPAWQRSLKPQASALGDRTPWITYGAIRFLQNQLRPDMRVFEYGAGGSSLFFANRVREGISVEHDPAWVGEVRRSLADQRLVNWTVKLVEPRHDGTERDPSDPANYTSSDPAQAGRSFRDYAAAIDEFPDDSFDIVMIDGRARPSCFMHAVPKVRPGGWLLLDNADWPGYRHVHVELDRLGWSRQVFAGPSPYGFNFSETCAWQCPLLEHLHDHARDRPRSKKPRYLISSAPS